MSNIDQNDRKGRVTEGLRVLLIDDDRALAAYHAALLHDVGLQVKVLMHPGEALGALRAFDPDLIVLDMHMPEMSGPQLAAAIRAQRSYDDTPIVLISADSNKQLIVDGLHQGFAGFYKKPLDPLLFPATARSLAGSARQLKQARRALESALIEIEKQRAIAHQASHAKSDFLSSMSHELRTPMNAVMGFSQLLTMDDKLTDQQKGHAAKIYRAGEHLMQLINDVLDLAKIEAGTIHVVIEPIDLDELIGDCLSMIEPIALAAGINITSITSSGYRVSADRVRAKQAVLNLLSNAIKYNKPLGQVSVVLMPSGSCVRISVSDTGIGIAEDKQAKLFRPFTRLGAEKTSIEGTGIGLVISQRLVALMHGTIGCASTPGSGSTFWIELPRL